MVLIGGLESHIIFGNISINNGLPIREKYPQKYLLYEVFMSTKRDICLKGQHYTTSKLNNDSKILKKIFRVTVPV